MNDRYAVIRNPIGHSKSPLIHLTFARDSGHDFDYMALEAPIGGCDAVGDQLFSPAAGRGLAAYCGCSVR